MLAESGMDAEATGDERKRAYDAFNAVVQSYTVALQAVNLVAVSPGIGEQLAGQIAIHGALRRGEPFPQVEAAAETLIDAARAERDEGFANLRGAMLVAACGALEYLAKTALVDQASSNPRRAAELLVGLTLKLSASDVLGLTPMEQWRAVADEAFDKLGTGGTPMYKRMTRLLTEFSLLALKDAQSKEILGILGPEEVRRFNEAYLVRNCLVHNGSRVSSTLARVKGYQLGAVIDLNGKRLTPLLTSLKKMADGINAFYLLPL